MAESAERKARIRPAAMIFPIRGWSLTAISSAFKRSMNSLAVRVDLFSVFMNLSYHRAAQYGILKIKRRASS